MDTHLRQEFFSSSTNSHIVLFGYNELPLLGNGWYGLEKSPEGILFRSSKPRAEIALPVSWTHVDICFYLTARPIHTGEPLRAVVRSGKSDFSILLDSNQWVLRGGKLVVDSSRSVRIEVSNPWSPHRLYENGDIRSLGILLSAVTIEKAGK